MNSQTAKDITGFRSYLPDALRLRFDEQLSVRAIALQLGLSHSTIHNLFQRFNASGITWPLPESLSVAQLDAILYANMLQPSGDGYLLPDWYGAEPRRHYVSVTHTKKKKWPLFMKHWRNAVRKTPCFTKMNWIFISTRKSVLTDSYAGSKSALSHRARMKSIILPVHCTAVRIKSATLVETVKIYPYLSDC